ncbi:MAG: sugar phosphate isomerase/epimerase [Verrucomicrobia bacterium]|nr:sugar phosphate isomerase/epimerase [Verrucomicrobiota bacterium]
MHPPTHCISRREALGRAGLLAATACLGQPGPVAAATSSPAAAGASATFVYCLNTSTIRGQKLDLAAEIDVAAKAGYQAIEPWVEAIDRYAKQGGSLKDLRRRAVDQGLTVESAIAFSPWIVDDDAQRAKGLERAKVEMDLVAQIGGLRLAAPPAGATNQPGLDLMKAAERYRALLELGDRMGVTPELELWGFSKNLHRLGEVAFVAIETGHPKACVVADLFHIYKGGSDFGGLRLFSGPALPVFHMNDYPATPAREQLNDSHRVFPGDGVAPLDRILRDLHAGGGRKVLSLELFNRKYWEQNALEVAKHGLDTMKAAVRKALG